MTSTLDDARGELLACPFCRGAVMFRKALWPSDGNVDSIIHAAPTKCGMIEFSDGTIDESILAKWNTRAAPVPQCDDDGPCFYCGEPTRHLAGDPGKWPLRFCQPDGTGITRFHHTRCVTSRLATPPSRSDEQP